MLTKFFLDFSYIKIIQTFWKYPQFASYNQLQPNTYTALMIVQMNKEGFILEHKSKTFKDLREASFGTQI